MILAFYCLLGTKIDLDGIVVFTINQELYKKYLSNHDKIEETIMNPEVLAQVESIVRMWGKQIEKVRNNFTFNYFTKFLLIKFE